MGVAQMRMPNEVTSLDAVMTLFHLVAHSCGASEFCR